MDNRWHLDSNNGGLLRPATIRVSTIEMPKINDFDFGYRYETCVFGLKFNNKTESYDVTESDVVDRYDTLSEAAAGHAKICREYGVKYP